MGREYSERRYAVAIERRCRRQFFLLNFSPGRSPAYLDARGVKGRVVDGGVLDRWVDVG